jgi:hypothetical protein
LLFSLKIVFPPPQNRFAAADIFRSILKERRRREENFFRGGNISARPGILMHVVKFRELSIHFADLA